LAGPEEDRFAVALEAGDGGPVGQVNGRDDAGLAAVDEGGWGVGVEDEGPGFALGEGEGDGFGGEGNLTGDFEGVGVEEHQLAGGAGEGPEFAVVGKLEVNEIAGKGYLSAEG